MTVKLVWATPDADKHIAYCARVSNPANQENENIAKLLRYCAKHSHWSVFEMASMCLEINTTRDIGRQILRHRSFSFQELSQRYSSVDVLPPAPLRECRLQDHKNRQNSIEIGGEQRELAEWWNGVQTYVTDTTEALYQRALEAGIAKEQARAILPEGLTSSRMYMSGTIRSWVTYLQVRLDQSTQREHQAIASGALKCLRQVAPVVCEAFEL